MTQIEEDFRKQPVGCAKQAREVITVSNDSYINGLTVCELLEKLRIFHSEIPITLVLDNARYQKCKLVFSKAEELNIELLFLPPYSPNLTIIERLWKHVKQSRLKNTYYEDFDSFRGAIDSKIDEVNTYLRDELSTLFSQNFQIVDTTNRNGFYDAFENSSIPSDSRTRQPLFKI